MTVVVALIPLALTLLGLLPMFAIVLVWRGMERRYVRESPLTRNLLRPPGYSLQKKIDDLGQDIDIFLLASMMIPVFVFLIHICQSYFIGESESMLRTASSIVAGAGLTVLSGWRLISLFKKRKQFVLGLEGERATGEELNQLMLDGCRVFHDIPFKYGNIDHVVVSQSGVYTVNSKMLGKPKSGNATAEITVDHPRGVVCFPDREYRIPVEQFETEANWLSQHLASAVGQPVKVEPILALPGWFVKERIGRGAVFVINPCKPKKFFVQNRQVLSPELVQQLAHQLDQICRDVEPSYQKKRVRWENEQ